MYKGDQWVGYDSPANVRRKMDYVKEMRLGGAMIWAVDLDDYLGSCGARWPLLSTMNRQLRRKESLGQSNRYLTPPCLALGGQVGVEVDDQVVEVAPVLVESEQEELEEQEEQEKEQEKEEEQEENIQSETVEEIDFDCPDSGFYSSPSRCDEYYQCTTEKKVINYKVPGYLIKSIKELNYC